MEDPGSPRRRGASRPARLGAICAPLLGAVGVWAALAPATSEQNQPRDESRQLLERGIALNEKGRHQKAVHVLRRARKALPGKAPERVRATANFELGVALRSSGRFKAAKKPLKRSRRLGLESGVGLELAKARSEIRE